MTLQHISSVPSGTAETVGAARRKWWQTMAFRPFVLVLFAIGLGLAWWAHHRSGYLGYGALSVVAVLACMSAISNRFPMLFVHGDTEVSFTLDFALLTYGLLRVPPQGALVSVVVGVLVGSAARKLSFAKTCFNVAQYLGMASIAAVATSLMAVDVHAAFTTHALFAVAAGIFAGSVYSSVAFSFAIRVLTQPLHPASLLDGSGAWLITLAGGISLGILAAVAGGVSSYVALVAIAPVALIQYVLNSHVQARRNRERADGLFRASVATHASIDDAAVRVALINSARQLLECETVEISLVPPQPNQIGQRISAANGGGEWLVAAQSLNTKGFTNDDIKVLDVLCAVGSTALDNARLVAEVRHQSYHDDLTGLPNQRNFDERVNEMGRTAQTGGAPFTVAVFDLDDFKKVNDSLGHSAGNELLVQISERLTTALGPGDTLARLGADDFTLIFPGVTNEAEIAEVTGRIANSIKAPFVVSNQRIFITATLGVTRCPLDGTNTDELLKCADVAMHKGKDQGGNTTTLFSSGMNAQADSDLRLQGELHAAVRNDELRVLYQPQVDLASNRIIGVEALVRWQHPERGFLAPYAFIELAERSDLIVDIDRWVLNETCRQAKEWDSMGLAPVRVAANLSGRHLKQLDVVDYVVNVLKRWNLAPSRLELEVTEGVTDRETDDSLKKLNEFRTLGVELAIDDFGTGYSGFARLGQFPIDRLKIDRSFIMAITPEKPEAPIVAAMIAMAHSLKLKVIAEGVETVEQLNYVTSLGCDEVQGYYFSKPVTAAEIVEKLLAQDAPRGTTVRL